MPKSNDVVTMSKRKEKIVLERKKYEISVITKVTIRALFNNAMVRILATTKIFSLKKTEYNPTAYKDVRTSLLKSLEGVRK